MHLRRMDYVHINGEGELVERPRGMLVDYASYAQLEQTLRNAREKLVLYRQAHSGEYIGGVEFNTLIHSIDAVLTPVSGGAVDGN